LPHAVPQPPHWYWQIETQRSVHEEEQQWGAMLQTHDSHMHPPQPGSGLTSHPEQGPQSHEQVVQSSPVDQSHQPSPQ
jgi:hypothetical protein